MESLSRWWRLLGLGLLLAAGCLSTAPEKVDLVVCDLAARPRDLTQSALPDLPPRAPREDTPQKAAGPSRLTVPPDLPGAIAPAISLPPLNAESAEKRREMLDQLYPSMSPPGPDPEPGPGPEGHPLTLQDLQQLALANSPLIRRASANVEAARGLALQAGLPPNPTVGYQADTIGTSATAGYQGGFVEQVVKTANKLQLSRAVAATDLANAELALRQAVSDLATQVRGGYFAVLVARENIRVARALVRFTSELYDLQVAQVRQGGFAAAYEPLQLRVVATQARGALVVARNRYTSAWKQLASALGLPGLPPTELAGNAEGPIPLYRHEDVLNHVLRRHTDVATAENTLQRARYSLRLARVTPVPDVDVRVTVQKDNTMPPFSVVSSVLVGVPLPVWDRNQGNIHQAEAALVGATEEAHRVRDDLTARLAEAFERYENNRVLLALYRDQVLPDQVRAFRALYDRYHREPLVGAASPPVFGDVVTAQQTLSAAVTTYLTYLGSTWQAVVDVAGLLQTDDLYRVDGQPTECFTGRPGPELLPALPCCHPCSPAPAPALKGAHGEWPPTGPGAERP